MAILESCDVHYVYKSKYQNVHALRGISYAFETGMLYAIVGKSGCGKTTFLSLLAGLDLPTEGSILYRGKPTESFDRNRYRREDMAIICQCFNLFPLLTVQENVMYPLRLKGISSKEASAIAEKKLRTVGLPESCFKRLPATLSGGEQQRVAIARALAGDAKIILADEPTGNLDTENSRNIIRLLKRLALEEDCCVIVVTHDISIAAEADAVICLSDGKIIETQ